MQCSTCGGRICEGERYRWWWRTDIARCSRCYEECSKELLDKIGPGEIGIVQKQPKAGAGLSKTKKPIPGQVALFDRSKYRRGGA